ncbi:MAG: sigma-54-dependent transcriptional regulator, partial [Luteitalea sp.]
MTAAVRTDTAPILIADDDDAVRASLALLLKQGGYRTHAVGTPDAAVAWLGEHPCALVLQDMNFSRRTSGDEGLELLRRIRDAHPLLPVILVTAWGSISLAVAGMRIGASDFVTKPWSNPGLLQTVQTALRLAGTAVGQDVAPPSREELDSSYDFDAIVTADARMLKLLQLVGRVAATDASVLITGESGTGKELIADALHRNSGRRRKPFVKVNLGGVSSSLFESEMFGHVRGAFTDARHDRQGRFELADGGTIFLDEIGDLDAPSQVKLLRVLQDRTYEVLGSSQPRSVDVRVVSATNRPLAEMVRRGEFREDLLYRINLIAVHLPALRERPGDVPLLARRFVQAIAQHQGREHLSLSPAALKWLQSLPWAGNIRQLKQWIE